MYVGRTSTDFTRPRRGMIIVAVLWIVAVVGFIAVTFAFRTRTDLKAGYYARNRLQAQMLAESGVARAMAALDEDDPTVDTLDESWADDPARFADAALAGLDDGVYSVLGRPHDDHLSRRFGLEDECAKLNINTATREMLLALPGMTEEIADAIIDWRDRDDDPGPLGAESAFYQGLSRYPYTAKNARFESVDELLLVRGVTSALLYGEDANRNGILDPNEDDGAETPPDDDRDGTLDVGLYRYLTVWSLTPNVDAAGRPRIYINQPWRSLRNALRQVIDDQQVIAQIVARRRRVTFQSTADLLDLPAVDEEVYAGIVDCLTVSQAKVIPGLVNPNTAPVPVLAALPGLEPEDAENLAAYRTENPDQAGSIAWVLQVVGLEKFKACCNFLTPRSAQFSCEVLGRFRTRPVFARLKVVIDRRRAPTRVVYRQDLTGLGLAYRPPEEEEFGD